MKREIIKIDAKKCTGCGLCVSGCPEGALQLIDGKARLVGELLCDGLGACIGQCPEGAIAIEVREAEKYDERKVVANIVPQGKAVLAAHLKHLKDHQQTEYLNQALDYLREKNIAVPTDEPAASHVHAGCPGSRMMNFTREDESESSGPTAELKSRLRQWPIQLQLLSPAAPYFQNADLVIAADCVPFSYPNFHERFLKGKALVIFCPKLDRVHEVYVEKMAEILRVNNIKSVSVVHMEVPCCYGTVSLLEEAMRQSGKNIPIKDYTISVGGEII